MATPFGHSFFAIILWRYGFPKHFVSTKQFYVDLLIVISLSILPDCDVFLGLLFGDAHLYHRIFSHSFCSGIIAGVTVWFIYCLCIGRYSKEILFLFCLAYASHLLLDLFTHDTAPPNGLQLLWPFYKKEIGIHFWIIPHVDKQSTNFLVSLLNYNNFITICVEMLLLGFPAIFIFLRRNSRSRYNNKRIRK